MRTAVAIVLTLLAMAGVLLGLAGLALVAFWAGPLTAVAVAFAGFGLLYGAVLAYGDGKGRLPNFPRRR